MKKTDMEQYNRRKRIQTIKRALVVLAVVLIVLSIGLNVYLLIRVVHLTGLINSLYELGLMNVR